MNIILGNNGQGKTNLVEALYFMTQGDSFRYSDNEVLIRKNQQVNSAVLRAELQVNNLDYQISLEIKKHEKTLLLNQKKVSALQLRKLFPIVIFSPESLSVIKESDEQRRNLLDEVLLSLGGISADSVKEYRKVLKTRNRVLRDFRDPEKSVANLDALLQSLNPLFLNAAVQLTLQRLRLLENLQTPMRQCAQRIIEANSPSPVDISVDYVISDQKVTDFSAELLMDTLRKRLLELEAAERSSGTSLVGPHKHDIRFVYNQNDSRFFCSQGQQRALIISFKMAQIVYHRKALKNDPVLILDDVLSELDQEKRLALVGFLQEFSSQIFITSTDVNLPDLGTELKTSVQKIQQGALL